MNHRDHFPCRPTAVGLIALLMGLGSHSHLARAQAGQDPGSQPPSAPINNLRRLHQAQTAQAQAQAQGGTATQGAGQPSTRGAGPATGARPGATPTPPTPPTGAAAGAGAGATAAPGSKKQGDTSELSQFEEAVEFEPRSPNYRVAFSLEDADLAQLVRVIGQLTGKRFIFGGKVRDIKATIYSPRKVTVREAYQAFLSILETNGLTVVPHGRFLKIVETQGAASQATPIYGTKQGAPGEDRFITRLHRLQSVSADEVAAVLMKFKTKDGDVATYPPSNMLIITDTGTNIRRMMQIVEEIDVGGAGDQVWIEPVHYASAADLAKRIGELFEISGGSKSSGPPGVPGQPPTSAASSSGGELNISKLVSDDRTNSLVIVATEKAYLRVLELLKKMDVPQSSEGEIHVLSLQHADSKELTKTLNEIISGAGSTSSPDPNNPGATVSHPTGGGGGSIFEGRVKVSADEATNSIVVVSSLRDYASLRAVVDRLDRPRRQVFIEAVILDLAVTRSNELGFNFHGGDAPEFGSNGNGLIYGGLNPLKTILLPNQTDLQGMALGVRGPGIPGSENLLGTGLTIPAFGALINAIATSSDTDVLSTPHILATDNVPAEINVGENIPLNTNLAPGIGGFGGIPGAAGGAAGAAGALGGLGGLGGFGGAFGRRQDVGTKIKIVPHLNESNEVRLELTEEISEARAALEGTAGAIPITKRNAQTTLVVEDQQSAIIGGLMRNRVAHTESKIPVLGDIPVLGALFRKTKDEMQKSNLILILTPYIIREQSDLRTIFERKMQERQQFLDRYFVFSDDTDYQPPRDYARTNGLVEFVRQSYKAVEEQKKLDELARPAELKTHEPGEPLEIPVSPAAPASGGVTPTPGQPTPPSSGNPAPAPNPVGGAAITPQSSSAPALRIPGRRRVRRTE